MRFSVTSVQFPLLTTASDTVVPLMEAAETATAAGLIWAHGDACTCCGG